PSPRRGGHRQPSCRLATGVLPSPRRRGAGGEVRLPFVTTVVRSSLHAQDDLALRMAAGRRFPGVTRLGQWKDLADDWLNLSRVDQIANRAQLLAAGLDDEPDESRPGLCWIVRRARADDGDDHAAIFHDLPG